MANQVHVVLLEDVASLGRAGDVVVVSEGYARNALFPDGKAALATPDVQAREKSKKEKKKKEEQLKLEELQALAEKLDGTELSFEVKVKEGEEIYGSISLKQVLEELNSQAGLSLITKDISIKKPIKSLGTYPMTVAVAPDIECTVHVAVIPDAESKERIENDEE